MPQQLKTCKRKTQDDEFFTMYKDCVRELHKYDLVITNPPFSQVREFLKHLVSIKIDFIIIVSDVLRYSIKNGKFDLDIPIYKGWDAQKFYRPDGTIKPVHCGWIASFPDAWGENKLLKGDKDDTGK